MKANRGCKVVLTLDDSMGWKPGPQLAYNGQSATIAGFGIRYREHDSPRSFNGCPSHLVKSRPCTELYRQHYSQEIEHA
jgi:hypothetical protein